VNGTINRRVRHWWRLLTRPLGLARHIALKIAYRLKPRRVLCLPVTLDIEPNNHCNFECPHCQVTHWAKRRISLGRESFERILDQVGGLISLNLQGMGEPLLNKQMLPMLRAGEARGIPMSFTSNGSVMTPAIAEGLARLRSTRIRFSVDGATAGVFERVRVGGSFENVCGNIRHLVQARGHAREPVIEVWTVVTQANVIELPELVRLVKELGVDAITFQLFVSNWGKSQMDPHAEPVRVPRRDPDLEAALRGAQEVARRVGIPLSIYRDDFLSRERPCSWPWRSAFIASNGDVVPCSIVADSDTVCMGNIFQQPFHQIWNGPAYQELRDRIRTHQLPHFCRNCYRDERMSER
jgi:radical SAM protein with 4Fe4S-binding SPASM domain